MRDVNKKFGNSLRHSLWASLGNSLRDSLWHNLNYSLWSLDNSLGHSLRDSLQRAIEVDTNNRRGDADE